jgi:hypothetical protein
MEAGGNAVRRFRKEDRVVVPLRETASERPVSPLNLFGRKQDIALQKARKDIHQRNHLRLWLAPFRVEGEEVLDSLADVFPLKRSCLQFNYVSDSVDDEQ